MFVSKIQLKSMLKKFISQKNKENNKAFSLIEVLIAILIASIMISSITESYRVIMSSAITSINVQKTINTVENFFFSLSLPPETTGVISTNIGTVNILANYRWDEKLSGYEIEVFATNVRFIYSVKSFIPQGTGS